MNQLVACKTYKQQAVLLVGFIINHNECAVVDNKLIRISQYHVLSCMVIVGMEVNQQHFGGVYSDTLRVKGRLKIIISGKIYPYHPCPASDYTLPKSGHTFSFNVLLLSML